MKSPSELVPRQRLEKWGAIISFPLSMDHNYLRFWRIGLNIFLLDKKNEMSFSK